MNFPLTNLKEKFRAGSLFTGMNLSFVDKAILKSIPGTVAADQILIRIAIGHVFWGPEDRLSNDNPDR